MTSQFTRETDSQITVILAFKIVHLSLCLITNRKQIWGAPYFFPPETISSLVFMIHSQAFSEET